jgi:ribonuclease R
MTKYKTKNSSKKRSSGELEKSIFFLMKNFPKKKFRSGRIAGKLKIKNSKESIISVLDKMATKGTLVKIKEDLYQISRADEKETSKDKISARGRIDMIKSGAAYVITEDDSSDVYVPKKHLKTAMHDDHVNIEYVLKQKSGKPEGRVVNIIERARDKFVGTCWVFGKRKVVEVTTQDMHFEVEIVNENDAIHGDRVIVKIVHFGSGGMMKGEIDAILSSDKAHDAEMNGMLINAGFDITFSEDIMNWTARLSDQITKVDLLDRKDLREVMTFTIDPKDAKDFDDAISYRVLENGDKEVGVHIADVSHFVGENDIIDKEARKRSTSVYLVDRVCPMLPERLSNELCSLRPNEDKFTFSAIFNFDQKGQIASRWFGKTLIHSDRRFTYEEAQDILDAGEGDCFEELRAVDKIAKSLRVERYRQGSIKFETDEVRFDLSAENEPIGVYIKERKNAHLLIEDLMLLANKEVAKFIGDRKNTGEIPFVYRVHDQPDPDKLRDFALLAKEFGISFNLNTPKEIARSFNEMSEKIENQADIDMLMPLAIRTMAKAEYSTDNIGHYGLAFPFYSHFTSPIRRYADLIVHRVLFHNLKREYRVNKVALEDTCKHISIQERKAVDVERESIKYMQVVYMTNKVGQVFEARVSGIIEKGIFVEVIESHAEGLISFNKIGPVSSLNSGRAIVRTSSGEREFRFGDKLRVKLMAVDLSKRQLDFDLEESE